MRFRAPPPAAVIRDAATPLGEMAWAPIVEYVKDASFVLLGEASHGTEDFYTLRAQITRQLIVDHGFSAVAIEGDWPDTDRVNRYVQGSGDAASAVEALAGFERFPTWMWRNTAVVTFLEWLHDHNQSGEVEKRVGFYGLDLYSLRTSIAAVISYLQQHEPAAAQAARKSYGCFDQYGHDTDTYAWATSQKGDATCEDAVSHELVALRERRHALVSGRGAAERDAFFSAEQNARVARNAEQYYRTMFHGRTASWNLRDRHMAETLEQLAQHLRGRGQPVKVIVWAHNSHVGDARATESGDEGQLTLGQLVREWHGSSAKLI